MNKKPRHLLTATLGCLLPALSIAPGSAAQTAPLQPDHSNRPDERTVHGVSAGAVTPGSGAYAAGPMAAGDWRPLFDGVSLDGWCQYGADDEEVRKWQVEDGALALQQRGVFPMWDLIRSAAFGGRSGDLMYCRETFGDFELRLQWMIGPGGNSGIFYLVADDAAKTPWLTGVEMQVLDDAGHRDGRNPARRAGALYDLVAPRQAVVKPPGEWNDVLIRVRGDHLEHWLNGVQVVDIVRGSSEWERRLAQSKFADMPRFGTARSGYIVLQDHGDPVWFRNIRVRTPPTP